MKIICSVKDEAMQQYLQPFYVPTAAVAVRAIKKEINTQGTPLYETPTDYDLYELGTFDEETGKHHNHEAPVRLARGKDLRDDTA